MKLSQTDMIVYFFATLALLYLVVIHPWEHMTNADVHKKLEHHASRPKKWVMPNPEDTKAAIGTAIKGPEVPPLDPNEPKAGSGGNGKGTGVYPDIYGPEILTAPGHSDKGTESSDNPSTYDFVPAAEFPAGPSEPAPFLNDFSKILKM